MVEGSIEQEIPLPMVPRPPKVGNNSLFCDNYPDKQTSNSILIYSQIFYYNVQLSVKYKRPQ
ncbi:MAG: hypothetical protein PWR04_1094 [Anaerophaga sp.]|nr:hypothetical protein [Anaerophaga sp.]